MIDQALSIAGALLVLGAYAANLAHRLDRDGPWYAGLNAVGSGMLGYVAWKSSPAGLVLIEVAWSAISLVALVTAIRRRLRARATP